MQKDIDKILYEQFSNIRADMDIQFNKMNENIDIKLYDKFNSVIKT